LGIGINREEANSWCRWRKQNQAVRVVKNFGKGKAPKEVEREGPEIQ